MLELAGIRVAYGAATAIWDVSLHIGDGELGQQGFRQWVGLTHGDEAH